MLYFIFIFYCPKKPKQLKSVMEFNFKISLWIGEFCYNCIIICKKLTYTIIDIFEIYLVDHSLHTYDYVYVKFLALHNKNIKVIKYIY